jgi:hypothetical protein
MRKDAAARTASERIRKPSDLEATLVGRSFVDGEPETRAARVLTARIVELTGNQRAFFGF